MVLAASTIRLMHEIAGEERPFKSSVGIRALQLHAMFDWSLWVKRVDIALIGGDPVILSRRIATLLREADRRNPPKIAILHPGSFSGAPLAALEDGFIRSKTGLAPPGKATGQDGAWQIMEREIDRAAGLLNSLGCSGIMAFEMVQGLKDMERDEVVLRLTRPEGQPRRNGPRPTGDIRSQIAMAPDEGRAADLYQRSEALFRRGINEMHHRFKDVLKEPPSGRRFADLIIAKRCELLSGFISPPKGATRKLAAEEVRKMVGAPYCLAGPPPPRVAQAVSFWLQDFDRATNVPISYASKEIDI
jgi:hypothetical protein